MRGSRYWHLLGDVDVRRWFENVVGILSYLEAKGVAGSYVKSMLKAVKSGFTTKASRLGARSR